MFPTDSVETCVTDLSSPTLWAGEGGGWWRERNCLDSKQTRGKVQGQRGRVLEHSVSYEPVGARVFPDDPTSWAERRQDVQE